jgi:hypothetical protein
VLKMSGPKSSMEAAAAGAGTEGGGCGASRFFVLSSSSFCCSSSLQVRPSLRFGFDLHRVLLHPRLWLARGAFFKAASAVQRSGVFGFLFGSHFCHWNDLVFDSTNRYPRLHQHRPIKAQEEGAGLDASHVEVQGLPLLGLRGRYREAEELAALEAP